MRRVADRRFRRAGVADILELTNRRRTTPFEALRYELFAEGDPETLAGEPVGISAVRSIFSALEATGTADVTGAGVAIINAAGAAASAGGATRDFLSRYPTAAITKNKVRR
jgi:hypothetical protein